MLWYYITRLHYITCLCCLYIIIFPACRSRAPACPASPAPVSPACRTGDFDLSYFVSIIIIIIIIIIIMMMMMISSSSSICLCRPVGRVGADDAGAEGSGAATDTPTVLFVASMPQAPPEAHRRRVRAGTISPSLPLNPFWDSCHISLAVLVCRCFWYLYITPHRCLRKSGMARPSFSAGCPGSGEPRSHAGSREREREREREINKSHKCSDTSTSIRKRPPCGSFRSRCRVLCNLLTALPFDNLSRENFGRGIVRDFLWHREDPPKVEGNYSPSMHINHFSCKDSITQSCLAKRLWTGYERLPHLILPGAEEAGIYTMIYYTILYYTIPYHTIPYYTILYYNILYYDILYYTIIYYTIIYYTIL